MSYTEYEKGFFIMGNQGSKEYNPLFELSAMKLNGETMRLLFFYIGAMDYDNKIRRHTQQEISEITTIARSAISKLNKNLIDAEIIYKDGRDLYLNGKYFRKGVKRYKRKS
jgi:hypothetical protein